MCRWAHHLRAQLLTRRPASSRAVRLSTGAFARKGDGEIRPSDRWCVQARENHGTHHRNRRHCCSCGNGLLTVTASGTQARHGDTRSPSFEGFAQQKTSLRPAQKTKTSECLDEPEESRTSCGKNDACLEDFLNPVSPALAVIPPVSPLQGLVAYIASFTVNITTLAGNASRSICAWSLRRPGATDTAMSWNIRRYLIDRFPY